MIHQNSCRSQVYSLPDLALQVRVGQVPTLERPLVEQPGFVLKAADQRTRVHLPPALQGGAGGGGGVSDANSTTCASRRQTEESVGVAG